MIKMVYLNDGEVREKTDRINTVRETLRLSMSEGESSFYLENKRG